MRSDDVRRAGSGRPRSSRARFFNRPPLTESLEQATFGDIDIAHSVAKMENEMLNFP